ncbi:DEAD/DEAH box helicase family protein [Ktedonobacter racemifer]|nr:DEAD/DEAH box helicase family protein [Ktedonobacter racemifer]
MYNINRQFDFDIEDLLLPKEVGARMLTEAETRLQLIDEKLAKAGWSVKRGNVKVEHPLPETGRSALENKQQYSAETRYDNERVDYLLFGEDEKPIAVVEAKKNSDDPLVGQWQAKQYAEHIERLYHRKPFLFLTNGDVHYFWDLTSGFVPRPISGFFNLEDLQRLRALQLYRKDLHKTKLNLNIAGKKRPYQKEAIESVLDAIEAGLRKFLLVMATGTGKTRTVIGLVDILLRASLIQNVLFLADRRELVTQAMGDLKHFLPREACSRMEGQEIDLTAHIHVATYPSIMQVYKRLSPGYYDLIIADESHRSIYQRYKEPFDYFNALQLGLTATPTDYIDHNTFELFGCSPRQPTFYYSYKRAVEEGFLVDFQKVLDTQTTFQIEGIKAEQLSPEMQKYLKDQGINLDDLDFEGSDLERKVSNTGTNDAIVNEFLEKCRKEAGGTLPAKSIIFAVSHYHAMELADSFRRVRPDLPYLAAVIDSHIVRADKLLDDFKRQDFPRVAISVDMLDTGIDVPAIQTLVFAKPVLSKVKFWQMIGRGTRLWEDPITKEKKKSFLILDHWKNFEYHDEHAKGEIPTLTAPLPVSLFLLRLEKLQLLREQGHDEARGAVDQLQQMLAGLPRDHIHVSPHRPFLDVLARHESWNYLDQDMATVTEKIGPLFRYYNEVNYLEMTFAIHTEQLAIAYLKGSPEQIRRLREHIERALKLLPTGLPEVQAQAEKIRWVLSNEFWQFLSYDRIMDMQRIFTPLMRHRQTESEPILKLTLPDNIASRRWIIYGPSGEGTFVDNYRSQVETHINNLADQIPTLYRIKHVLAQQEPSLDEMQAIAETLNKPDLYITEEILRRVYEKSDAGLQDFLYHILGRRRFMSREEQVRENLQRFMNEFPAVLASRKDFLRTVGTWILNNKPLVQEDLEKPPFSRIGNARKLFTSQELQRILEFANTQLAS